MDCVSEGVASDFSVIADGGFELIGEGDVLKDVRSSGVVEVDSVVVVGWCCSVRVRLAVLLVECAPVVIMKKNEWEIVEDVVDVVVFVELCVGGLDTK